MSDGIYISVLGLGVVAGLLLGWFAARLRSQRQITDLQSGNAALHTTLELERRNCEEKLSAAQAARTQLDETFAALSSKALKHNSEEFLKLAAENLKQYQISAEASMQQREQSIEHIVKPIREALEKTERQIQELEKARREAYGSLTAHLEHMAQTQRLLHSETRNLVQALRRPEVRGRWGEMTLKRLAELAGMVDYCDFYEQQQSSGRDSTLRPDMIVRMPDDREIVVDAKTPLDAYLDAIEAHDDALRATALQRHARNVRERVRELAGKAYWNQFSKSPDFVVLFIPGDQFLSAALDIDRELLEDALRQKVILATPTSLVALLRAVAYGWRQNAVAENAEHIRHIGEELYQRLANLQEHLTRLGKSLAGSVDHFNKALGSFDRQVIPGARKFKDMGISAKKPVSAIEPLEVSVRQTTSDSEFNDQQR